MYKVELRLLPVAPVGCDHLDSQLRQLVIQWIGIIGTVTDEPLRQLRYESRVEGGSDEATLVRRSRGGTSGER
jgi:hypothetical protein